MDFKGRFLEQTCSLEGAEMWGLETRRDTHIGLQLIEFLEEALVSTMIIKDVVQ